MYKKRLITKRLKRLVESFPVVVLTGARQVGKSTLLKEVFPDYEHVTFDPVIDIGYSKAEPKIFLDNHRAPVIFDEIQYAPELVSAIKRQIDKNRENGRYILTGTQQWSVMKNISEALTGRAVFLHMESFSLSESAEDIPERNWLQRWLEDETEEFRNSAARLPSSDRSLNELLWRGFLPQADMTDIENIVEYYDSYIKTYIERDVRQLMDTGNWATFGRFLQILSALTAQEINFSRYAKDLDVSYKSIQNWLSIVAGTFQWYQLPAYSGNTLKRIRSKPKGYIADTALACSLNRISSYKTLSGHPLSGALFETAVVNEIRKLSTAFGMPPGFYHWRSAGGAEVDLVMERDGILFPIEVKLTSNPGPRHTSGLNAFRKTYPNMRIAPGLVVCPCERFAKITENDYAMPWDSV